MDGAIDLAVEMASLGSIVAVSWDDSTCRLDWHDEEEVEEFATNGAWHVENIGYLVYRDRECVVVAARRAGNGMRGLLERIPRRAITSIWQLREGVVPPSAGSGRG